MNELSEKAQEAIRWLFSNEALNFNVMEARIEIAKRFGTEVARELQEWTLHTPCKSA